MVNVRRVKRVAEEEGERGRVWNFSLGVQFSRIALPCVVVQWCRSAVVVSSSSCSYGGRNSWQWYLWVQAVTEGT